MRDLGAKGSLGGPGLAMPTGGVGAAPLSHLPVPASPRARQWLLVHNSLFPAELRTPQLRTLGSHPRETGVAFALERTACS